ncbi:MAG: radical SAM protein [Candidatus Yanofskybacteria bacterium]|nr:radical SAM protein [Candidatus Yanofskybacteria bacterium]
MLYPNARGMSLVPPAIGLFTRILRDGGFEVDLLDTTHYHIPGFVDPESERTRNLFFPDTPALVRGQGLASDALVEKVLSFQPNLIAVTVTESTFMIAVQLIRHLREQTGSKIPNVFGGVFPTFAPSRALDFPEVDSVCVGEGELVLPALCKRLEQGHSLEGLPSLWTRSATGEVQQSVMAPVVNVDAVPIPDFSLFQDERFHRALGGRMWRMVPVETHRGCPYTCTFCNSPAQTDLFNGAGAGSFFRKKSAARIREEIRSAIEHVGINYVFFWADTFFAWSLAELEGFCEMYSEFRLPFWCQTRPETVSAHVEGPRKLRMLREVGLDWISFGLEHGNERFRREIVNRCYSNDLVVEALHIPRELGIPFTVNNIIGLPDETRELAFDTIELNRRINANTLSCSTFTPYFGTPLRDYAVQKGYMDPAFICPSNAEDSILRMAQFTPEQIRGLTRTFMMYVRFPKSRWPEIQRAEQCTPEGDAIHEELHREFEETFFRAADA